MYDRLVDCLLIISNLNFIDKMTATSHFCENIYGNILQSPVVVIIFWRFTINFYFFNIVKVEEIDGLYRRYYFIKIKIVVSQPV